MLTSLNNDVIISKRRQFAGYRLVVWTYEGSLGTCRQWRLGESVNIKDKGYLIEWLLANAIALTLLCTARY